MKLAYVTLGKAAHLGRVRGDHVVDVTSRLGVASMTGLMADWPRLEVAIKALPQRPAFLKAGDVVRVEIDELGAIENRVAPDPADVLIS